MCKHNIQTPVSFYNEMTGFKTLKVLRQEINLSFVLFTLCILYLTQFFIVLFDTYFFPLYYSRTYFYDISIFVNKYKRFPALVEVFLYMANQSFFMTGKRFKSLSNHFWYSFSIVKFEFLGSMTSFKAFHKL